MKMAYWKEYAMGAAAGAGLVAVVFGAYMIGYTQKSNDISGTAESEVTQEFEHAAEPPEVTPEQLADENGGDSPVNGGCRDCEESPAYTYEPPPAKIDSAQCTEEQRYKNFVVGVTGCVHWAQPQVCEALATRSYMSNPKSYLPKECFE